MSRERLCDNYELCDWDSRRPAVVEMVERWRSPGSSEWVLSIRRYCVPCMRLDRADTAALRRSARRRGSRLIAGAVYGRTRLTWLTTLVNGEVPA